MLTHIHIRDFTIIDHLDLELKPGMCVLTGETGAGKSIIVEALGLVLGDRADSTTVRHGAMKADISIVVDISDLPTAYAWLIEHGIDSDGECILRRTIMRDGRSRAYINSIPSPLGTIRSLGEMLVDIHGQHAHQSLLRRDMQRILLDTQAGNEQRLQRLAALFQQWQGIKHKLETLANEQEEHQARVDLLRYQVQELRDLNLGFNEIHVLEDEHQRLANVERLRQTCQATYFTLYETDELALHFQLERLISALDELIDIDSNLTEYRDLLAEAQIQIDEAAQGLRRYSSHLEADPKRLEWVENRIGLLHELARKHRVTPDELPSRLETLVAELNTLERPEDNPEKLKKRLGEVEAEYRQLALEIRQSRLGAAKKLNKQTTAAMQNLGMEHGQFRIAVEPMEETQWSASGLDRIECRVTTNPGQPLKPLTKVASGGELSRISLAIQMVAARSMTIPTLVYDEVDTGIGGAVAETVGRQLHILGSDRQILCVTHLPQVAAQAHHHFQVTKIRTESRTLAQIVLLTSQGRVQEIARMLGGLEMTAQTQAHAEEMINRAQNQ
jgi:DNA repair protein RecN (Recombination protein N)